ncbi:MAG: gliding motility-associated protein GldE [Schleiferiaceae bacterium]|nr:gliding motility-associated protein GldE [Schleiferiaceae bacterium]
MDFSDWLWPGHIAWAWGLFVFLLLLSALTSAAEVSFFAIRGQELDKLRHGQSPQHRRAMKLLNQPRTLLATLVFVNLVSNLTLVFLGLLLSHRSWQVNTFSAAGFWPTVGLLLLVLLLLGEVVPRLVAARQPWEMARRITRPVLVMQALLGPVSHAMTTSSQSLQKWLRGPAYDHASEDLSKALELTQHEETTQEEKKILEGIVHFGQTQATQVMRPRLDVVCVDCSWDYKKVLEVILDSGYSRIPAFRDNIDNLQGILYIKDLLPHINEGADFHWQALIREAYFVPESKMIDDLLSEFQYRKIHLAVVVDEFGGTSGIITLEDVIEEIVGEISDEFDDDELVYSKLDEDNYVFEGKINLSDFCRILEVEETLFDPYHEEADTLAGVLLELVGKFPEKGEEVSLDPFTFKVESLEGRRLKRIKVTRHS